MRFSILSCLTLLLALIYCTGLIADASSSPITYDVTGLSPGQSVAFRLYSMDNFGTSPTPATTITYITTSLPPVPTITATPFNDTTAIVNIQIGGYVSDGTTRKGNYTLLYNLVSAGSTYNTYAVLPYTLNSSSTTGNVTINLFATANANVWLKVYATNDAGVGTTSSATMVALLPVCGVISVVNCLNTSYCHVAYEDDPIVCTSPAPTDPCSPLTTSASCGAAFCLWDAYVGNCFDSLQQIDLIFPCSTWAVPLYGQEACPWHGCALSNNGEDCLVYGSNGTTPGNPSVTVNNEVFFNTPTVMQDSTIITGTIYVPIQFTLYSETQPAVFNPSWYVFASGISSSTTFSQLSACSSLTNTMPAGVPPVVDYIPGAAALKTYFINWVNAHHNFNFNLSDPAGVALAGYFGNITISAVEGASNLLTRVDISPDHVYVIFTYTQDMNYLYTNCRGYGVSFSQSGGITHWSLPFSVWQRTGSNTWSSSSVAYFVTFSGTGTVTLSQSIAYTPSASLLDIATNATGCATGETTLQASYALTYSHVEDTQSRVGPRYASDIVIRNPDTAALVNCYGDKPLSISTPSCSSASQSCTTTIVMQSRCRALSLDGLAFEQCSYADPADIATDLGNSSDSYPTDLDAVHNFYSYSYVCPASGNMTACYPVNPAPFAPDLVASMISITEYPRQFASVPALSITFGLLPTANSETLDGAVTLTNEFNATSSALGTPLYTLPAEGVLDRFSVAIQLTDLPVRVAYTLQLLLPNLTITPLNAEGTVDTEGLVLTWTDLQAYAVFQPSQMLTTDNCGACHGLPLCSGVSGCDGFSVPVYALITQSPAQGYLIQLSYMVTLPAPDQQQQQQSRRLLQLVSVLSGNSASTTQYLYVNTTWFAPDSPRSGFQSWALGQQISVIAVPIVLAISISIVVAYCFYRLSPNRYNTRAQRRRRQTTATVAT